MQHLFNKAAALSLHHFKRDTSTQVFSCEFCEIFKDTFFTEHLHMTAY